MANPEHVESTMQGAAVITSGGFGKTAATWKRKSVRKFTVLGSYKSNFNRDFLHTVWIGDISWTSKTSFRIWGQDLLCWSH